MRLTTFIALIVLLSPITLFAGGTHYTAEILDFEFKGNDEFLMIIKQYETPYASGEKLKPQIVKIHLRHKTKECEKDVYLRAINTLISQFKKGGKFKFGIVGNGYLPIKGKTNEYQSNRLELLEEYDGKKAVYSFIN